MDEVTKTALHVCTFKGSQNIALYVAQQQGFFAAQSLDVIIEYTAGSAAQLAGLARGDYHLVQTAPDNVINVDNNPAAFGLDPTSSPHIVMLFGGSTGPLSLYAQPDIMSISNLQDRTLGVDNPTSGFGLVVRDILARAGLVVERDYTFVHAGGTGTRLEGLLRGAFAATILYAPFDTIASEKGLSKLATSTDYYSAYASLCTAGAQNWVEANVDSVTRYISALLQALSWLYDAEHATAVQNMIQQEPALKLDADMALHAYKAFIDPVVGFGREGRLEETGLQQVIDVRAAYGSRLRPLGKPAQYQDLRWYHQAIERIKI
jgi:ABC-type nitrate/sulfonate/bicarbonate transport system substrate-binding protein